MKRIKSISLNLPMEATGYTVGEPVYEISLSDDLKRVTEIKDCSMEYEDGIEFIYDIYVEDQLYQSIVNSSVSVTYFLDGEEGME